MTALDSWLLEQASSLDGIIAAASEAEFNRHSEWSAFELDQTLEDIWQLSRRGDCCYDRPSIGPTYALWYHGRRTQDMLRVLRRWCDETDTEEWSVIDLGSGTGATIWALALLAVGLHRCGQKPPRVQVHAIDSSPFMLSFAERMWVLHFQSAYPESRQFLDVTFRTDTWVRVSVACRQRARICAGYLFDHSDAERVPEIATALQSVADRHEAGRVIAHAARAKADLLDLACRSFDRNRWESRGNPPCHAVYWSGDLDQCHTARSSVYGKLLKNSPGRWSRPPMWGADETVARELKSLVPRQEALFGAPEPPALLLDSEQQKAAEVDSRPAVIIGAAGSGKSVVLAERIARTVNSANANDSILVTSFNKRMIDQLASWVQERLAEGYRLIPNKQTPSSTNPDDVVCGHWRLHADGSSHDIPALEIMNWDLAPTKLFGVDWRRVPVLVGEELEEHVEEAIANTRLELGLTPDQYSDILNREFLLAERHRVVYGLGALSRGEYMSVERIGRGRPLQRAQREVVASAMSKITNTMIQRRIEALRRVRGSERCRYNKGHAIPRFTHLFVDECQDFTAADFEQFHYLNNHAECVVVAGDLTQSMRLGPSYRIPSLPSSSRWRRHRLGGSYRIPLRVCEAIRPIAEFVRDKHGVNDADEVVMPESRKAAVLGTRPVLIVADDVCNAARQIREVWSVYGEALGLQRITIVEEDTDLRDQLVAGVGSAVRVELQSMNRIKGLERPFVVWSTRLGFDADESVEEWAFTVYSRTTSILILVVTPDSDNKLLSIVRLLRRDRLMPWTQQAYQWLADDNSHR